MNLHEESFFRFKDIFCTRKLVDKQFSGNPHPHFFWFNAEKEAKFHQFSTYQKYFKNIKSETKMPNFRRPRIFKIFPIDQNP